MASISCPTGITSVEIRYGINCPYASQVQNCSKCISGSTSCTFNIGYSMCGSDPCYGINPKIAKVSVKCNLGSISVSGSSYVAPKGTGTVPNKLFVDGDQAKIQCSTSISSVVVRYSINCPYTNQLQTCNPCSISDSIQECILPVGYSMCGSDPCYGIGPKIANITVTCSNNVLPVFSGSSYVAPTAVGTVSNKLFVDGDQAKIQCSTSISSVVVRYSINCPYTNQLQTCNPCNVQQNIQECILPVGYSMCGSDPCYGINPKIANITVTCSNNVLPVFLGSNYTAPTAVGKVSNKLFVDGDQAKIQCSTSISSVVVRYSINCPYTNQLQTCNPCNVQQNTQECILPVGYSMCGSDPCYGIYPKIANITVTCSNNVLPVFSSSSYFPPIVQGINSSRIYKDGEQARIECASSISSVVVKYSTNCPNSNQIQTCNPCNTNQNIQICVLPVGYSMCGSDPCYGTNPKYANISVTCKNNELPYFANQGDCLFYVPNCQKCPKTGITVTSDISTVSCIQFGSVWQWVFGDYTGTVVINDKDILLDGTTAVVKGNLNTKKNTTLVFFVEPSKRSLLTVEGCVSLEGQINVTISGDTNKTSTYEIIRYNCSSLINVVDNQIKITMNSSPNKCEKINTQLNNFQNSLSISLSTVSDSSCGNNGNNNNKSNGIPLGALIGIILGAVFAAILISLVIFVGLYRRRLKTKRFMKNASLEMSKMG